MLGWWVKSAVACRLHWSRSVFRSSIWVRSFARSRSRSYCSFSSICANCSGVSCRTVGVACHSVACCAEYTLNNSAVSICHWFLSSLEAANLPARMASKIVDFCFPVAFTACQSVKADMFSLCVFPNVRPILGKGQGLPVFFTLTNYPPGHGQWSQTAFSGMNRISMRFVLEFLHIYGLLPNCKLSFPKIDTFNRDRDCKHISGLLIEI